MNRETMKAFQLDRRLATRRGWINEDQVAEATAQLPDVADKVAPAGEAGDDAASEAPADPAQA